MLEGVAVLGQRVGDEAVVGRIGRIAVKEVAVEPDGAAVVVHLVLVPGALGDLHHDLDVHWVALPGSSGTAATLPSRARRTDG